MIEAPVHLAVPFAIVGNRAQTVEQNTLDELIQNVAVIVGTQRGERLAVPAFGVSDPTFRSDVEIPEIEAAIAQWEERADARVERALPTSDGEQRVTIAVSFRGDS